MDSRRSFITNLAKGFVFSSLALPSMASQRISGNSRSKKLARIGIIGAENSHTVGFGKIFNIEKRFPDFEVCCVWGETEEFAKVAMRDGNIPEMVSDPLAMLGKIDALIVDHRHPKYHLQAAEPFVKAGIPTFIDKPFCYRVSEGREFLSMARKIGTPVTSYSSQAQSAATYDIRDQIASFGEIAHIISVGPTDLESIYGGVFFYGIHLVQPLMVIFGEDIRKVRVSRQGKTATASMILGDGKLATLVFKRLSSGFQTFVETKSGLVELKSRVEETNPGKNYVDMVEMFRTRKEPLPHSSILKPIAVLEALEKSAISDNWEDVPPVE